MQTAHAHTNALPEHLKSDLRVMRHFVVPPEGVDIVIEHPIQFIGVKRVGLKFIAYALEMSTDCAPRSIRIKWYTKECYIPPKLRYLGSEASSNELLHFYYGTVEQFEDQ